MKYCNIVFILIVIFLTAAAMWQLLGLPEVCQRFYARCCRKLMDREGVAGIELKLPAEGSAETLAMCVTFQDGASVTDVFFHGPGIRLIRNIGVLFCDTSVGFYSTLRSCCRKHRRTA